MRESTRFSNPELADFMRPPTISGFFTRAYLPQSGGVDIIRRQRQVGSEACHLLFVDYTNRVYESQAAYGAALKIWF